MRGRRITQFGCAPFAGCARKSNPGPTDVQEKDSAQALCKRVIAANNNQVATHRNCERPDLDVYGCYSPEITPSCSGRQKT